jgi:hypothetical protein
MSESFRVTVDQARAALMEVSARAGQVHRSDRRLAWMLLVAAGVYFVAGIAVSLSPHEGRSVAGPAVVGILAVAVGASIAIGIRIKAYSRAAITWFFATMIGFSLWNALIVGTSVATRFWAPGQPGYHFGISVAVATLPLLAGAAQIGRRR